MLNMGGEYPQAMASRRSRHSQPDDTVGDKIAEVLTLLLLATLMSAAVLQI